MLSLGQLSRWYQLLRPISLRSKIARTYGLDQQVLESLLHHLTYIRNLCAHHGRVWNRELTITAPVLRSKPPELAKTVRAGRRDRRARGAFGGSAPVHRFPICADKFQTATTSRCCTRCMSTRCCPASRRYRPCHGSTARIRRRTRTSRTRASSTTRRWRGS
ncbi:MAG: Abi family protein [Pseudomonadota bacterium]